MPTDDEIQAARDQRRAQLLAELEQLGDLEKSAVKPRPKAKPKPKPKPESEALRRPMLNDEDDLNTTHSVIRGSMGSGWGEIGGSGHFF